MNRPWPTAAEIDATQGDGFDRKWSCFDFSECTHSSGTIAYVGPWQLDVCNDCGHTETACLHLVCDWNDEGTLLRCRTCGIDGT